MDSGPWDGQRTPGGTAGPGRDRGALGGTGGPGRDSVPQEEQDSGPWEGRGAPGGKAGPQKGKWGPGGTAEPQDGQDSGPWEGQRVPRRDKGTPGGKAASREGQWGLRGTEGPGRDRGAPGRTADSRRDSGPREGQRAPGGTEGSGTDSGPREGQPPGRSFLSEEPCGRASQVALPGCWCSIRSGETFRAPPFRCHVSSFGPRLQVWGHPRCRRRGRVCACRLLATRVRQGLQSCHSRAHSLPCGPPPSGPGPSGAAAGAPPSRPSAPSGPRASSLWALLAFFRGTRGLVCDELSCSGFLWGGGGGQGLRAFKSSGGAAGAREDLRPRSFHQHFICSSLDFSSLLVMPTCV